MNNQVQRRWDFVIFSSLMFTLEVVSSEVSSKTSFYYLLWILLGYFSYRGELQKMKSLLMGLIIINLGVIGIVSWFIEDSFLIQYIHTDKFSIVLGLIIVFFLKIIVFFYLKYDLRKIFIPRREFHGIMEQDTRSISTITKFSFNQMNGYIRLWIFTSTLFLLFFSIFVSMNFKSFSLKDLIGILIVTFVFSLTIFVLCYLILWVLKGFNIINLYSTYNKILISIFTVSILITSYLFFSPYRSCMKQTQNFEYCHQNTSW